MKLSLSFQEIQKEFKLQQAKYTLEDEFVDHSFQESASVLYFFDPQKLNRRIHENDPFPEIVTGWSNFFTFCDPFRNKTGGNWWQLRPELRHQALKRLGSREEMLNVLELNPDRSNDRAQILFESILRGTSYNMYELDREDLVMLIGILEWVSDILHDSDTIETVKRWLPIADLLAPLKFLVTDSFVGREKELQTIAEYVGLDSSFNLKVASKRLLQQFIFDLKNNPLLLISGPGGIGKSTLIGRFILKNAETAGKGDLTFAYLNADKSIINPERPSTFVIEAARQLALQNRSQSDRFNKLIYEIENRLLSYDAIEISKSFDIDNFASFAFGEIVRTIQSPVLLVLDTFEEIQFLGSEVVYSVWKLLALMQESAPNLRIIVAGRSEVKEFPIQSLVLSELSRDEARQLIFSELKDFRIQNKNIEELISEIINFIGSNPLSLRLASLLIQEQGIEALRKVEARNWLLLRIRSEVLQARIYGRILGHIHDENVKKLAYPGLIVRRITADLIIEVLAGPCGIDLNSNVSAEHLMTTLSKEVALIEVDPSDGALCHRQDVRRIMLKDLKNEIEEALIEKIHDSAIEYYAKRNDLISRAEEIYHRLSLGKKLDIIEKRWLQGIEQYLRNALDELPVGSRILLSKKLRVTPDIELLKNAEIESWEEITTKTAQRYIQSGNLKKALDVIRVRGERSLNSPLYRLELEILRSLGRYKEALKLVKGVLSKCSGSGEPAPVRELLMQAALIMESIGSLAESLNYVQLAENLSGNQPSHVALLRIWITHIRLLRKLKNNKTDEYLKISGLAIGLLNQPGVLDQIRNAPALLRELTAELGRMMPELLDIAIESIGVQVLDEDQQEFLIKRISKLDPDLKKENIAGSDLGRKIQHLRKELNTNQSLSEFVPKLDKTLIEHFKRNVDTSLFRTEKTLPINRKFKGM